MASIHRVLSRILNAIPVWNFTELDSEQRAELSQQFNPYIC